jgi:hypothetical protein
MPLIGEYEPSTWSATRDQVELFEKSQGAEGKTLLGLPVVIITTTGKGLSAGGTVQDAAARRDYTARELDGKERETWWAPAAIPMRTRTSIRPVPSASAIRRWISTALSRR